ncbi:MAG: protein kinase [Candidatus Aureabacteria bacterium]|nr:protein kinase [Candidatus Auribacterota bacterium]
MEGDNTRTQFGAAGSQEYSFVKRTVGKYVIEREISRGGMGIVFESRQKELGRRVAIKVLPLTTCHSPASMERFKREAATVAKIRHSGVAQVYDFGEDENCHYIVMEFVEGETLEEKLKKKSIDLKQAIDIIRRVALILEDLHRQQILHRDIKPSNIMIKENGDIVLLDFGISKCLDDENLYKITHEPLGTPAYMPPEFIRSCGSLSDIRSDIYSLGVVLYEAATGELPFGRESYYEIIDRILKGDFIAPRKKNPRISKSLETIILKCMAVSVEERYGSSKGLAEDIERYTKKIPLKASRGLVVFRYILSYHRRLLMASSGLVIFFLLALGMMSFFNRYPERIVLERLEWKEVVFPANNPLSEQIQVFKDIEGEIPVKAMEQFVSVDDAGGSLTWLRNTTGYLVFKSEFPGDIRISFESGFPKEEEFFGVFINSQMRLTGYMLRIDSKKISLSKGYYENIIKSHLIENPKDTNLFLFERIGPEVNVYFNGEEIIRFIDYDPIIGEENSHAGLFFKSGFRKIKDLKVFEPRQPLAISPLIVGQRFYELGQYENAIKEYRKIIKEYPEESISLIARFKMGMSYRQLERYEKALEAFDQIISMGKRESDIMAETYFQKGVCLFHMGNEDWAEEIFEKTIQDFQNTDVSLNIFMFLYERISEKIAGEFGYKDFPEVEKRFRFVMEKFPSQRPLMTINARILIEKMIGLGLFDKALLHIELLKEYFPYHTSTVAWGEIKKGDIYLKMKDTEKAKKTFEDVYQDYKGYSVYKALALSRLGNLYLDSGDIDKAEEIFETIFYRYSEQTEFSYEASIKLKLIENIRKMR